MKQHTKIYMTAFGYTVADFIACEMPQCGNRAVDINHIDARGMGGDPTHSKDTIENLMAMCRACHVEYGDRKDYKFRLRDIHKRHMQRYGVKFDKSKI